jgi:hypothetical protein
LLFCRPFSRPARGSFGNGVESAEAFGNAAHIEQTLGSLLYECASHEKLDMLPFWYPAPPPPLKIIN